MNAIVTVFARDDKGITAYVSTILAENEINILDISQTLMHGHFTMIMLVDLSECKMPFDQLSAYLREMGEKRNLNMSITRQDIFESMHRI